MAKARKARTSRGTNNAGTAAPEAVPMHEDAVRVVVVGRAARMQTFNLPHEIYCKVLGECSCSERTVVTSTYSKVDKGEVRYTVAKKKRVNSSLTVRHKQRVAVPRAALRCPEVASAIRSKDLRVES